MLVTPADALYDEPIKLRLDNLPASKQVVVRAVATDDLGHRWESHAEFVTTANGAIDLASTKPVSGSYDIGDANGLLWSMTLDPSIVERTPFVKNNVEPLIVKLTAEIIDE